MKRLSVVLFAVLFALSAAAAAESEEDLIAQAKREGEVIYYSVVRSSAEAPIIQAFEKEYPFVKVNRYRAGQSALLERILQESRANRYPDVVTNNFFQLLTLADRGLLESYEFPAQKAVRKGFVDPEHRFTALGITPFAISFNTQSLKLAEIPKQYQDFLDPKWKGQLGLIPQVGWVLSILDALGDEKGEAFLRGLAKQNVRINSGNSLQLQLLAAGEFKVGIPNIVYLVANLKAKGAPVDFAYIDPVYTDFSGTGLVAKGPHKAAAKLFLRYLFSQQAQELYKDSGRLPGRADVSPEDLRLVEGVTFEPYKASWVKDVGKAQKLADTLFGGAK